MHDPLAIASSTRLRRLHGICPLIYHYLAIVGVDKVQSIRTVVLLVFEPRNGLSSATINVSHEGDPLGTFLELMQMASTHRT
jgi:hypothetical protein